MPDTTDTEEWLEGIMRMCDIPDDTSEEWLKGFRHGLKLYAWWQGGVEYVGCGAKTLAQALRDVDQMAGESNMGQDRN